MLKPASRLDSLSSLLNVVPLAGSFQISWNSHPSKLIFLGLTLDTEYTKLRLLLSMVVLKI